MDYTQVSLSDNYTFPPLGSLLLTKNIIETYERLGHSNVQKKRESDLPLSKLCKQRFRYPMAHW